MVRDVVGHWFCLEWQYIDAVDSPTIAVYIGGRQHVRWLFIISFVMSLPYVYSNVLFRVRRPIESVSVLWRNKNRHFITSIIIDHTRSSMVHNFGRVYLSVCLSVCLSDDNFRKPWRRKFISAHPVCLQEYMGQVRLRRSSGQVQSHRRSKSAILLIWNFDRPSFRFYKIAMKFACCVEFSAMADWMVWPPSLSHDRKWPRVTKCTHSRVAGLRL